MKSIFAYLKLNKSSGKSSLESNKPKKKIAQQKVIRVGLYATAVVALLVIGVFAFYAKDLPSPDKINARQVIESTKIYDRTGEHLLYEVHGEEKRTMIAFDQMPDTIKYATIALEDQDFYRHHGIKITSIIRAVLKDVLRGGTASQGGSTITQQFIKNSILTPEKSLTRKLKEFILALEIEQKFSKDEILRMYLNEIPYGSNAYGIEAATRTFFGKPARDLNLAQACLLASLPQAPSRYSPHGSNPELLKARQEYCLDQMNNLGYINDEQAQNAKQEDVLNQVIPRQESIEAPHFVMYIKEYLEEKYGEETVEQGGLRVHTTLDWEMQKKAEELVKTKAFENQTRWNAENAALVAMDPKTGQILAMAGSRDYFDQNIDGQVNVAIRLRQPGSSFKPYVYLTAFKKGYTPETILFDVETNFETADGKEYKPKNYDGKTRGPVKIKEALGMSLNIPAVKTLYLAGVDESISTAQSMGITSLKDRRRYGLSLVLGGGEITLLDHVNAFGTLANGGVRIDKTPILKVSDRRGETLEEFKQTQGERVVEEKYVTAVDHILSTNKYRAPVFGENSPLKFDDGLVAAKTGTTNEFRDGWTVGYTPSIAVGVWTGNNDNSPMREGADGVNTAGPIWRGFMDWVLPKYNQDKFPDYDAENYRTGKEVLDGKLDSDEDEIKVCKVHGKDKYCLANKYCPDDRVEKKKFSDYHTILYYVKKDDPLGDSPQKGDTDPQFNEWEKAVRRWAEKDGHSSDEAPTEECDKDDFDDYAAQVSIDVKYTSSSSEATISASADSAYGISKVKFYADGDEIGSEGGKSPSMKYKIPDSKNNSTIEFRVKAIDDNGNEADDTEKVSVSF